MRPPQPLAQRLWVYQRERFPLVAMLPMCLFFSFAAIAFSRLSNGRTDFVPMTHWLTAALTSFYLFFLLRVLDEHKDREIDAKFRSELPVPRGLVALSELRALAWGLGLVCLALNAWFMPRLLWPLGAVALWTTLMTYEFFVHEWLRSHMVLYLVSHMAIMPLIDLYSTGVDWWMAGQLPHPSLLFFLLATFFNGVVVEIGRKLRLPEDEREGWATYSKLWGFRTAILVWMGVLLLTGVLATLSGAATGLNGIRLATLSGAVVLGLGLGLRLWLKPTHSGAKQVEWISASWTLIMYAWLGLAPWFGAR